MKRKLMKNLLLVVAMVVLCLAVGVTASAEDRTLIDSGECGAQGDNVIWTLYDDGELVISGEGEMEDYDSINDVFTPWNDISVMINSLVIENGVENIGRYSFYNCINLELIELPDTISRIGDFAFYNTKYYNYSSNWEDNVLYIGNYLIKGQNLKYYSVKEGTMLIADHALDSSGLKSITIPDSVKSIGHQAFDDCVGLENVTLGKGLEIIYSAAFCDCRNLKEIIIPNGVKCIEEGAFFGCNIENIYIPESVTFIGVGELSTFGDSLKSIEVDENNSYYSSDEYGALFNKDKTKILLYPDKNERKTYKIPDSVEEIGEFSFNNCFYLQNLELPEKLKKIETGAFFCSLFAFDKIYLDKNVELIELGAFYCCPFLDEIYIESMTTSIGEMALGATVLYTKDISKEDYAEKWILYAFHNNNEAIEPYTYWEECFIGTIYCHSGSTAEAYAIANGVDYVLTHFYEGEWLYDAENKYCYRQCIHCDEREISENIGDIEIEAPVTPDADFTVDVVEDYVIIEETISNNITTDFEIIKAFDINLKNKDGGHIQPNGTVKVKLPNDWSKSGVYKVYRVNDDGTLTDMNAYRQGSHLVFDTDHFSVYVIVVEGAEPDSPTTPDEDTKDNFFTKIFDLIKSFFELILSLFK